MFQTMKQLFAPTNKDLRQRILFTLGVLTIFIVGTYVQIPGTPPIDETGSSLLGTLNSFTGGAMQKFSIFALGVTPYITASIIVQLLQMDIIPYFSELKDEGPTGRQKINKITRYMGIIFAFIEGFIFGIAFLGSGKTTMDFMYVATIITAGTAFLLWLGDQITQKGIGNGISLLIMAGIIATLPSTFGTVFQDLVASGKYELWLGIIMMVLFVIMYFVVVIAVIYMEEAQRRIPIQYANKSTSFGSNQSYMPVKINTAGVVPVIFASSLLTIPAVLAQFVNNQGFTDFVNNYLSYTKPVGFVIFIVLIYFFAYFYTFIQLRPEELAKNLKDNGGFIPGIRPGKDTEDYISKVLSRLTVFGALFLSAIAALPIVFSLITGLPQNVSIGGTSLLIVVGVALETFRQLEGSLVSRNYKRGYTGRR